MTQLIKRLFKGILARRCAKVKDMVGKPIDVVFCGSDYDETAFGSNVIRKVSFIS